MNNTGRYGAGVVLNYTGGTIRNNIICFNSQSSTFNGGAGIWSYGSLAGAQKVIENNTIINNSATIGTAGVLCQNTTMTIRNNIIWGNASPGNSQILLSAGTVTVTYCDVQNGYTGAGNISSYPQFADTNYILLNNSPCVDAGDSSVIYNDPSDPGNPGNGLFPAKGTLRNDMGAYGGPGSMLLSANMVINVNENKNSLPESFKLYQNYPNPFNAMTLIKFDIGNAKKSFVSLKIFDLLGKEITTLVNQSLSAGTYNVSFNGNGISSGIYFYSLYLNGAKIDTKRFILIK